MDLSANLAFLSLSHRPFSALARQAASGKALHPGLMYALDTFPIVAHISPLVTHVSTHP